MGTGSLVIGLIVFAVALFPNLGYFVLIPAALGLILGVSKLARDGYCQMSIAGVILNGLAILLAIFWTAVVSVTAAGEVERFLDRVAPKPAIELPVRMMAPEKEHPVKRMASPSPAATAPVK